MTWPIGHSQYIPGPSSFREMMPEAMKAITQCAGIIQGENVAILFAPERVFTLTTNLYWTKGSY